MMNAEIMKTGTNHYSGSSDNVIPLSLRSPDALSPSVEQSISGQSPHHNEVVDESKRRERNTGEAEAAGLHPVPLSA